MSCCGSKRQQVVGATNVPQAAAQRATATSVLFVYDGMAPLTLTGSASGRRYHFAQHGARLAVDARDVPALQSVPKLRRLST